MEYLKEISTNLQSRKKNHSHVFLSVHDPEMDFLTKDIHRL